VWGKCAGVTDVTILTFELVNPNAVKPSTVVLTLNKNLPSDKHMYARAGWTGVRIQVAKDFFRLKTHTDRPWGPPSPASFPGNSGRSVTLSTHFHLAPQLRLGAAVPPPTSVPSWHTQWRTSNFIWYMTHQTRLVAHIIKTKHFSGCKNIVARLFGTEIKIRV
jgi:hypothetical protein